MAPDRVGPCLAALLLISGCALLPAGDRGPPAGLTSSGANDIGVLLERDGRLDQALGYFRQSVRLDPENPVAWTNLGNVHRKRGEAEHARAAYRQALTVNPDYLPARHNLQALEQAGP